MLRALTSFTFFFCLTGCFGYGDIGAPCTKRTDCRGELVCQGKQCSNPEGCRTRHECVYDGLCTAWGKHCVAETDRDCESSKACADHGLCSAARLTCKAKDDADCAKSLDCRDAGRCRADIGLCAFGGHSTEANHLAHCGSQCLVYGRCTIDGEGKCIAGKDDCPPSYACTHEGLCSLEQKDNTCRALTDADCANAAVCKEGGACRALNGVCVKTGDTWCSTQPQCLSEGLCTEIQGVCRAVSERDCQGTPLCHQIGRCTAIGGKCVVGDHLDCERSVDCRIDGRCVSRDGKCIVARDADCEKSTHCKTWGFCSVIGDRCLARDKADCVQNDSCKKEGRCTPRNGWCVVASSADCRKSELCEKDGLCSLRETVVETLDHTVPKVMELNARMDLSCGAMKGKDCKKSRACLVEDRCEAEGGVCVEMAGDVTRTGR